MPMPPYPPAQVTRAITFVISQGFLQADGTPSGSAFWNNGFGLYTLPNPAPVINGPGRVDYRTYLYENGGGTPVDGADEQDLPDLVSAVWAWSAALYNNLDPVGPYFCANGAPTVNASLAAFLNDSATCVHLGGDPAGFYRPQGLGGTGPVVDMAPLDWKLAIGNGVGAGDGFLSCENPPDVGSAGIKFTQLQISGTATWLAWWWRLSEDAEGKPRDACGNRQPDAPYIYRREDPSAETGYQWEKLDPNDSTAHPTPVIESIEPSHGRVQGAEPIIIRGSGFGTEATVTFDGVSALDVNVISQHEIQVVDPPHLAGYVNVVVTNFDGVSS
jgi:hypothetical protein